MTSLSLGGGRRVKVSMTFEAVDDEIVSMAMDPEVRIQLARDLRTRDVDDEVVDREMGIKVTPLAQITVTREDGAVETSVFMTKDELKHHIFEARAILHTLDPAADLADGVWAKYRRGLSGRRDEQDHPDRARRHESDLGTGGGGDVER